MMSRLSIDIYSATNPALCSVILWSFGSGFTSVNSKGVDYPLLFLPIPIVLSKSLVETFNQTNASTGFLNWVIRSPEITIGLAEKLEKTSPYTRSALLFGFQHQMFTINSAGNLILLDEFTLSTYRQRSLSEDIRQAISLSKRLGNWLGNLDSTSNAFYSLGLTL